MFVVALMGGLGNQMYQFSLGMMLAKATAVPVRYQTDMFDFYGDRQLELESLGIAVEKVGRNEVRSILGAPFSSPFVKRLLASRRGGFLRPSGFVADTGRTTSEIVALAQRRQKLYFHGYWQQADLVARADSAFWCGYRFPQPEEVSARAWMDRIAASAHPVAVHVRLGDYASAKRALQHHGLLSPAYYRNACDMVASRLVDAEFFVFSDQPDLAKRYFADTRNHVNFVETGSARAWTDMSLMAACHHNIIANSTYSWWSAWLNRNPRKIVVAPTPWFADGTSDAGLVPDDWTRIPR